MPIFIILLNYNIVKWFWMYLYLKPKFNTISCVYKIVENCQLYNHGREIAPPLPLWVKVPPYSLVSSFGVRLVLISAVEIASITAPETTTKVREEKFNVSYWVKCVKNLTIIVHKEKGVTPYHWGYTAFSKILPYTARAKFPGFCFSYLIFVLLNLTNTSCF